jgi:hypothetical protein
MYGRVKGFHRIRCGTRILAGSFARDRGSEFPFSLSPTNSRGTEVWSDQFRRPIEKDICYNSQPTTYTLVKSLSMILDENEPDGKSYEGSRSCFSSI